MRLNHVPTLPILLWKVCPIVQQNFDCVNDGADIGLGTSTANAHGFRSLGQLVGHVNRDHQYPDFRMFPRDLARYVKPIQVRHVKI
jgi:hypothetical protein